MILHATFLPSLHQYFKHIKMKTKFLSCAIILLLTTQFIAAQDFTFGVESGVNYSNLRKTNDNKRFDALPGPVNGIFVKYELGNWFTLQSGLNHASYYYNEYVRYYYDYLWGASSSYYDLSSSMIAYPGYNSLETYKFSFLRVPLLLKFRTPGRVNFEVGGGPYYAFLTNDEFRGKDRDIHTDENENSPKLHDWGWMMEGSLNYNLNNRWSLFASARITYGKEKYFESVEGKMGSSEFTFGVGYKPFKEKDIAQRSDSIGKNISVLPYSGVNISGIKSQENNSKYKSTVGFSSGVSLKFILGSNASFVTGVRYERKGFNLEYQGQYAAFYYPEELSSPSYIKSDVQLDYVTFPFLWDISFGKKVESHFNFGVYFSMLQNAFAEGEQITENNWGQGYQLTKSYFNKSLDLWFKNSDGGAMISYRVELPLFKWGKVFVSAEQSIGLKDILDDNEDLMSQYNFINDEEFRNRSTSIYFGLNIPVNPK